MLRRSIVVIAVAIIWAAVVAATAWWVAKPAKSTKYFSPRTCPSSATVSLIPRCACRASPKSRSRASRAATTAFLISTPQTGVDSIAVTAALLGPVYAVFRPLAALLTGVLGGSLVQLAEGKEPTVTNGAEATGPPAAGSRMRAALSYGFETLPRDIGKALLVGLVLAALISVLVPAGSLTGLLGGGVLPVLLMMAVGIPLYVCATGSVPLAAGFIHAGVSPGAALAFLIAGPATNAATVTTLMRVLGRRTMVIYLSTVAASAFGGGLLLDAVAGSLDLRLPLLHAGHDHESISWLSHVWAGLLVLVMAWALWPWRTRSAGDCCTDGTCENAGSTDGGQTATLSVEGMNCSHCTESVHRVLSEQEGVRTVTVSLETSSAVVTGRGLDTRALAAAVTELGYPATVA